MKRLFLMMPLLVSLAGCGLFGVKPNPTTAKASGDTGVVAKVAPNLPAETDNSFSTQFIALLNTYRAQHNMAAVAQDMTLNDFALLHSQDMANRGVMDHANLHSDFTYIGRQHCDQNVAWNYTTPQTLFDAWQASPAHNANLLDARVTTAGTAIVNGYATLWVCTGP